jgi:hypothetical protein
MLSPPTASPAPSTSRSSSSPFLIPDLRGLNIGLASATLVRIVGLEVMQTGRDNANPDVGYEPMVGDDAAELTAELGTVIGMGKGLPFGVRVMRTGDMRDWWFSRRYDIDGDAARRLEALGYGSYRSSTTMNQASQKYVKFMRCKVSRKLTFTLV